MSTQMMEETFGPNPYGDQSKGWAILSVTWASVLVAFITTIVRVWIRARVTRNFGMDDWMILLAMATTVMGAGFISGEVFNGLGRHVFYLTKSQRRLFKAIAWADWIQAMFTLGVTKIAIALFLLRIVENRKIIKGLYALIAFTTLFTSVCIFIFLGMCRPLRAHWDIGVDATCLSKKQIEATVIAQGVLSIITDLICAALPSIFLRNLQVSKRTKVGLCTLMGLGVITAGCCAVRTSLSGSEGDSDVTWATATSTAWRIPEVNIGIICANAPILRPLYLFFRGRLATQQRATGGTAGSHSKERIWPSQAQRIRLGKDSKEGGRGWGYGSGDTAVEGVELEMGLPEGGLGGGGGGGVGGKREGF